MFERAFHRSTVTQPGVGILCPCRARAAYRIWPSGSNGKGAFYRCPACAGTYDNAKFEHEALPHVRTQFENLVYASYREQRTRFPHVTPERWAAGFRETFGPRIQQLEARYQEELSIAAEAREAADALIGGVR